MDKKIIEELLAAARDTADKSYSPYSKFPVGAALLGKSGKIYTGTNIENASYGLTNCAERTAVFSAVTAGEREFDAILIYTPTEKFTTPCGACRQVLAEFSPEMTVILAKEDGGTMITKLSDIFPWNFNLK